MNPISSDIFGRLDWLTKRVKRLCCSVDKLKEEVDNISVNVITDNYTTQGTGVLGDPVKSNLSNNYYQNTDDGTAVLLSPGYTFHFIYPDPFGGAISCTIDGTNVTIEEGRRMILSNYSGFDANVSGNLPLPGSILQNTKTAEFVGIIDPLSIITTPQWLLINIY